jgi:tyrosine-protein kinase Etk/Wzc
MTALPDETGLHIVVLLVRRWRSIAICAALGLGLATVYCLRAAPWFEARLTVVPSHHSEDMGLFAKLPSIGGLGSSLGSDVQRINAVLTSRSVTDEVIAKFGLTERYGTPHIEQTRQALWAHCRTGVDRKSGVVELICEDKDPAMAKAMTEYFGEIGNQVFGRISVSSAREERRFLEKQVLQARTDVDKASADLREFQEKHRLIDLPEQSKAVISAMASIKGDLMSKQLELSYVNSFSSPTEARVVQLQQQIAILEGKLRQLEDSTPPATAPAAHTPPTPAVPAKSDFFPEAMRVPDLRFQLEQLVREQKIKETLFFLMTQRYETAKVDEARDTSTFQILDSPTLPTYKSRPRRLRILMIGLVAGSAIASAWILGRAWLQRRFLASRP